MGLVHLLNENSVIIYINNKSVYFPMKNLVTSFYSVLLVSKIIIIITNHSHRLSLKAMDCRFNVLEDNWPSLLSSQGFFSPFKHHGSFLITGRLLPLA